MKTVSLLNKARDSHRVAKPSRAFLAILAVVSLTAVHSVYAEVVKVEYGGGWVVTPQVSGSYDSVTGSSSDTAFVYGAKTGAGVDLIANGSASLLGPATSYTDLSARTDGSGTMWGVNTAGAIDLISWNGTWGSETRASGNYVSVAQHTGNADQSYAARSDGGIDLIRWNGTWGSETLLSSATKYVDLAPTRVSAANGYMFGVTDAGAVDFISWNGAWNAETLASGDYISVAARSNDDQIYAARASGGIDTLSWAGAGNPWNVTPLITSSTVFTDLATDLAGNDFVWATTAIPEPATMGLLVFVGGGILFIRKRFLI